MGFGTEKGFPITIKELGTRVSVSPGQTATPAKATITSRVTTSVA